MTPPPLWLAILQAARVDRNLRGEDLRVLLYAAEYLTPDDPRVLQAWHAGRVLGIHTQSAWRAVQRLEAAGYLVPHVPTGGHTLAVPTTSADGTTRRISAKRSVVAA